MREQEYQWYLLGCSRMGKPPFPLEIFEAKWQEFEEHATQLKEAEENQTLTALDAKERLTMQSRFQNDDFVRALLIGMAESQAQS